MKILLRRSAWLAVVTLSLSASARSSGSDKPLVIDLWPGKPPGETKTWPAEADQTKPDGRLVAGRRVTRLGNVSIPQIHVYHPRKARPNRAAILICPGGGHHILAFDLEGTEVAQWVNSLGLTAIVLKYRVPFRDRNKRWRAAVQDAQRAMSLVRGHAKQWKIDPGRIGICGFSAGGQTAALAAAFDAERQYEPVDGVDRISSRPDFAMLIYPGGLVTRQEPTRLIDDLQITRRMPPTFLVHAMDDGVSAQNSLIVASKLKTVGVPTEIHVFARGGHGYGLRRTDAAVTHWPELAEQWMNGLELLDRTTGNH